MLDAQEGVTEQDVSLLGLVLERGRGTISTPSARFRCVVRTAAI